MRPCERALFTFIYEKIKFIARQNRSIAVNFQLLWENYFSKINITH